jgi:adenylate cyclase
MRRSIMGLGIAVTVLMVFLSAWAPPLLTRAREAVFDTYQRAAPRPHDPASPVHVVDIDEAALALYGQWPWPRSYMAELTDRLFENGAVAVGFDVLFPEPDRTSPERITESWARFADGIPPALPDLGLVPHDTRFAQAIAGRPVVLSLAGGPEGQVPVPKAGVAVTGSGAAGLAQFPAAIGNLPDLTEAAAGLGTISLGRDEGGITRTVPMVTRFENVLMPSLSAELLRVAQGAGGHVLRTTEASGEISGGTRAVVAMQTGGARYPLEGDGRFRIHFSGERADRVTPVARVLETPAPDPALQERLAGRIVLVGSRAQGLFDIRSTPLGTQMPGVLLHAEIIEQIAAQDFLVRPDWMGGVEIVLIVLAGLTLTLIQLRERPLLGLGAGFGLVALLVGLGLLLFAQAGILFDPILPVLTVLAVYLPGTTLGFFAKDRARRAIRAQFAYFLPPDLIGQIEENPQSALTPAGAERDLTVLFVDMRGFSQMTEGMAPDQVVVLVNTFLSYVTDALLTHGATIDKYMGDAVMAFWNAPIPRDDHAAAALGAIPSVIEAADRANFALADAGFPVVSVGIGVNTGTAAVGLMGSRDRLGYTCIGETVTLAARLEGLTRLYGVTNCVGEATAAAVGPGETALCLDLIAAKGFKQAAPVYTVLPADTPGLSALAACLKTARAAYLRRDWAGAEHDFRALAQMSLDGWGDPAQLAALYLERIEAFYRVPPPPHWDGAAQAIFK